MTKTIIWLLIIAALSMYSLTVYSWWIEGDNNQRLHQIDEQDKDCRLYKIC